MLDAGQKGKHIAIQMCCSEAQVSAIGTGRAFKRLALKSAKHAGRPPLAPLPLAKRKLILAQMCRAEFLYGSGISQTAAQEAVTGRRGQHHPAMRRVTLQAMRTCQDLIDRCRASVGPPDPVTKCRKWTGATQKTGPACTAYLAGETIDAHRVLLALSGRVIKPRERLRFTCENADGLCCELSHVQSKADRHAAIA